MQAHMQNNLLFLQGRWSFASLQSIQPRLFWFLFEQGTNFPLELKWATFAMLCPTDQSTVPALGSFRGRFWRSSCPRSCSASLCWSQAAWLCASNWTVCHPSHPSILHPRPGYLLGCATESRSAAFGGGGCGMQREACRCTFQLQSSSPWFECAVVYVSSL